MEALLSIGLTLVIVVFSFALAALVMLVSVGMTVFFIWLRLKNGGGLVISFPAFVVPNIAAPPPKSKHVKVSTCPACGAGRSMPSKTAYMYCEYCGQLMDWDFRAAMSDRRSRAPGPAYEALLRKHTPSLERAKREKDAESYQSIQAELWEAYAKACPAALSPRIGDAEYRKEWVEWTARSQTLQDLSDSTAATFAAQSTATQRLQWDRSNPFQPRAEPETFRSLLDAVCDHQQAVCDLLESEELLDSHPDHVSGDVMRKIGLSAFVQGWMQYLPPSEHAPMLEKTGLDGEYLEPEPVDLTTGTCPCCTKPLEVHPDAKRVVCEACGHVIAVKGGSLPCHGCGASIEIPATGSDFNCPHCDRHVARIGL